MTTPVCIRKVKFMKNKILIIILIIFILLLFSYNIINKSKEISYKLANTNTYPIKNSNTNSNIHSITYDYEQYKDLPINYATVQYEYDMSTPEKTIGVADYAFIGKINGILRTEYRNPSEGIINDKLQIITEPYTIYSVSVISNIKGELTTTENIEVAECGGLNENMQSYTFLEKMGLLNVGEYYILMPYVESDGTLGLSHPKSIIALGNIEEDNTIKTVKTQKNTVETLKDINLLNVAKETVEKKIALGQRIETTPMEIIDEYVKASKDQIVPESKVINNISKYDVNYER